MRKAEGVSASLGNFTARVSSALQEIRTQKIISRIWQRDHTVWKPNPTEISNRLGWLDSPEVMRPSIPEINACVNAVRAEGFTQALLLGMGGSSLAPEVFRSTFGVQPGYPDLAVLDSTHPGAVAHHARRLDLSKTLFIVSTKSGGTVETFSFLKYFYQQVVPALGAESAGDHFIAITDPGSGLADTAKALRFRKTFLNDPNIGGRYSALSFFGLFPAALIGVDVARLLERARTMAQDSKSEDFPPTGENSPVWLGAVLGEMAAAGRDKVTLVASPVLASLSGWIEQLIAESTGKEGQGILPVSEQEPGSIEAYAQDRVFVYLRLAGDATHDAKIKQLAAAGHPVVQLDLEDAYDLGGEFMRWEIATVIAGRRLGINPFDQPNVESAKVLARKMVAEFQERGKLPELVPTSREAGITVFAETPAPTPREALRAFLAEAQTTGGRRPYVALHAYLAPEDSTDAALNTLAQRIRDRHQFAVTLGYGPRFLHSTGQLHKGDAGNGLFIQFIARLAADLDIPDAASAPASHMTFGTLVQAQALGDRQALRDNHRHVIRFDLGTEVAGNLHKLAEWV